MFISNCLKENISYLKNKLMVDKSFDIVLREISVKNKNIVFFFINGFSRDDTLQKIMEYIVIEGEKKWPKDIEEFNKELIPYIQTEIISTMEEAVKNILAGVSCIFVEGFSAAIAIDARDYPARSVEEPPKDRVLRGSRDGFVETLIMNTALIRRRIRDEKLIVTMTNMGSRSKTDIAIMYLEDKADLHLVEELKKKIETIKVEALTMNIESFAECLLEGPYINPFPKFKFTERPDTAASGIYEGNVVVIIDNAPCAILLPTSVFDVLEEADDYYFPPLIGIYLRISRYILTVISFALTPLWMLIIKHPELAPNALSFVMIHDDVVVPVILQFLMLEIGVDGLRLAAVNTPNMLSTPLSIVAGIVVGQYAVSSGWFNSETLLYMAIVTVGNYSHASFEFGYALKIMRMFTLIMTWWLGIYGFVFGVIFTICLIVFNKTLSKKSYIYPIYPFDKEKLIAKIFRIRLPHQK